MGEYVKYIGRTTKIGTCENLYYTTYQQYTAALNAGYLSRVDGNLYPFSYAKPNSGFRFRFPFPDEDKIQIGGHEDFDRGVPVKVDYDFQNDVLIPKSQGFQTLEIVQQKLVNRESDGMLCLAIVLKDPENHHRFRLEDDDAVDQLLCCILKHHVLFESDQSKKQFYQIMARRLLKGYRLENTVRQRYLPKRLPPDNRLLGGLGI